MKIYLYLSAAIISINLVTSGNIWAQCLGTQDCATLGYTQTSCPNGGVKCPFGNKWACSSEDDNSRYCDVGMLYYSDNTCSSDYNSSKTLLGVVIYSDSSGGGWIMTVKPVKTNIEWSISFTDIPELFNCTSISCIPDIHASCRNTDIITAYGNSSTYPAAWTAKNYKPAGTPSGKSWCLPSSGLLNNLNNSVNFAKVNAGITAAGGEILGNVSNGYESVWSSSEYSAKRVLIFSASKTGRLRLVASSKTNYGDSARSVRPVMAF